MFHIFAIPIETLSLWQQKKATRKIERIFLYFLKIFNKTLLNSKPQLLGKNIFFPPRNFLFPHSSEGLLLLVKVEKGRRKWQRPFRLLEAGRGQQCLWWRAKEREEEKGRIEIEKKAKRKE